MPRSSRRPRTEALLLLLLAGCADDRVPLEDCTYARYWADCTGNVETTADPVVGCDGTTGECRWFLGGVTARGHVVSDCDLDPVCCHGSSPFTDWSPSGEAWSQAQHDLSLLMSGPLGPAGPHDVPVVNDYVGVPTDVTITCSSDLSLVPCGVRTSPYPWTRRVGDALLFELGGGGPPRPALQIEIFPATGANRSARVYVHGRGPIDGPDPLCSAAWIGHAVPVLSGSLHLSSDSDEDLEALHGRFEGVTETGSFTIEF